ncbi:hypothetical protein N7474_003213 [Penicillium riverlandense]|uniref:uncharacterized protein n=1 Tax=Penicillium riverlandense TaxID=1903569 RepID=UPI002547677D|nr:uncharacterized protein N7474_003213 [Penicillium riverlandense]KAJ5826075.1 hypothetical protein N7474_003213 [Penicillium riverlandense]
MRFHGVAIALLGITAFVCAAPTGTADGQTPLPDGLPNPSQEQLAEIEQNARGTLPNSPPPPFISEMGITNLKLIAFNELFEVAYFNELLMNITTNVTGYTFSDDKDRDFIIEAFTAILAQEELHALSANGGLSHFGVDPIQPCRYQFPVEDFKSAVVLASTFTGLVLGTLQDVVERFANGQDFDLARQISSIIGQEGEQQGWYRVIQGKIPSELPFLTTSDLSFAFTAIQSFVVPGSCPNIEEIPLATFEPLTIATSPDPETQNITVVFKDPGFNDRNELWISYINQQNLPIVESLDILSQEHGTVTAEAIFPYTEHEMNGFTIAAITKSRGPFSNAYAVAADTVAGPGLIIVN